jgi:transposase
MGGFSRGKELASYIGWTPLEYSTGQYVRQGRITRSGNRQAQACLVSLSWILIQIQKDPWMRFKYQRFKQFKGAKRAIIAFDRTLIIRIQRILLNNESLCSWCLLMK